MRREAQRLWEQSLYDLDTAQKLLNIGIFYASVFFSQQAAEKALKALYLERMKKMEFSHDLTELAEALGAADEIFQAACELSPDYVISRYPNAANAVPARLYNEESAKKHLEYGQRIIQWVKKELGLET